jgi:DNA-binding NtrC family response regulator
METILLVDDDSSVRKSVGEMLTRSGYSVLTAGDGIAALDALRENSGVDLVITDHLMPGMDGLALTCRIKESSPDMPVVIITGYGDLESYLCATGLGVVRYVSKPFGLRKLQRIVRDAVSDALCEKTLHEVTRRVIS